MHNGAHSSVKPLALDANVKDTRKFKCVDLMLPYEQPWPYS